MSSYDPRKIEEYQLILMKNPRSKVFAALSEAYRKMQMHEEALETARKGIGHNPNYPSGLVAMARILVDLKKYIDAIPHLEKALRIRHENLLALKMLAHCQLQTKNIQGALKSYKKLLFLNPSDEKAQLFVKKWEFLEGADYDFEHPLVPPEELDQWVQSLPTPEDLLTVVDTFLQKKDHFSAAHLVRAGGKKWAHNPDFIRRQKIIASLKPVDPVHLAKKLFWQNWLHRIEKHRQSQSSI